VCNGIETCDPDDGCQSGTPLSCNDGNRCTVDTCNPVTGCANTPKNCQDGNPCTNDYCNPLSGACVHENICEGEGEDEGEGECPGEGEGEGECSMGFALEITPNPAESGDDVYFTVVELPGSCSSGILQYEWKWRPEDKHGNDFEVIPDACNSSEYIMEDADSSDTGTYVCTISDDSDSFATAPVFLRVFLSIPVVALAGMGLLVTVIAITGKHLLRKR